MKKTFPTLNILLAALQQDVPGCNISRTTLWRTLKHHNFVYGKLKKKPVLMESSTVANIRMEYLRSIKSYRDSNWSIYFLDETWCGANHTLQTGWMEHVTENRRDNFDEYRFGVQQIDGYRGGFVTPCGAGKRVIILHVGNENGFVDGCMNCFIGKDLYIVQFFTYVNRLFTN